MKKKAIRLLALMLCAGLLFSMIPCASVSAAETEAEENAVTDSVNGTVSANEASAASDLIKLGTPTELLWGYYTENIWNEETEEYDRVPVKGRPGDTCWKTALPDQGHVEITVYRKNGDTDKCIHKEWTDYGSQYSFDYDSSRLSWLTLESGSYYFTVTSKGDNTQYCDSDTAVSDIWEYVQPSAQVDICTNLSWNWPNIQFDPPADNSGLGGYSARFYYAASADEEPTSISDFITFDPEIALFIPDFYIQQYGTGYYYYSIQTISDNIEVACHSEWSEMSPAYNLTEASESIETQLDNIMASSDNMTDAEIRESVQALDTTELKAAMDADQDNTGVVADIAALEEEVGGAAPVEVRDDAADFDASQITVIGANLNNASSSEPITLVIDKPEEDHVLDAAYNNSVAVSFSMDLENVEDPENLEVPVKIIMPVPETINPDFLVILHYHANGTVEEIFPHIYKENGQYYASFVLTSFSDFIMTQPADSVDPDTADVLRVSGGTRYETSFAIAAQLKEVLGVETFDTIIVASGESYPDALSGSYLSTMKNAPILLTNKSMNSTVLDYIEENLSTGGMVYILGGVNSVTQSFEDSLNESGIQNRRLSGNTRLETNLAILEEAQVNGDKILISTAYNYADSLSASASGLPVLLLDTNANKLTDAQKEFLKAHSGCEFYILGGVNTVSEQLAEAVGAYGTVQRVSGDTREATSVAVASFVENPECVVLAYSRNYPDGLCGGVLAYNLKAPVILTNSGMEDLAAEYVQANGISKGVILGGPNSVKESSVDLIFAAAEEDD